MRKLTQLPKGKWTRSSGELIPIFDVEKEMFFELNNKYEFMKKLDVINKKPVLSLKKVNKRIEKGSEDQS